MKRLFSLLYMLVTFTLFGNQSHDSEQSIKDPVTNITFPKSVTFEENGKSYTLTATGVATRQKLFAKVYSVAHYLQNPSSGSQNALFEEILNDNLKAKQLTLHWVRAVNVKSIKEAYEEAIHKAISEKERSLLSSEIATFLSFFTQGTSVGDIYIFRWIPKGILTVEMNGKKVGEIDNPQFAKAIWSIWLGKQSIVNRTKLVANLSKN